MSRSANGHAQTMVAFYRREKRMIEEMDRRKKSGKDNDDDHDTHITHTNEEGERTWTY